MVMVIDRERLLMRDRVARSKYAPLYRHLLSREPETEWRTGFGDIERVLGFRLPASARLYGAWWANSRMGSRHSQALAWQAAGWRTARVDLGAETLVFEREAEAPVKAGPMRYERGGDDMSWLGDGLRDAPATVDLPPPQAVWQRGRDWNLDRDFPPWSGGPWPEGFTASRGQIYDGMARLTGGPEDGSGSDG